MRSPWGPIFPFIRQASELLSEEVCRNADNGIHRFTARPTTTRMAIIPINRPTT